MSADGLLKFDWPLPRGVRAAFTTRSGGASSAPWDSFNVATHVGDAPAAVHAGIDLPRDRPARPARAAIETAAGGDLDDLAAAQPEEPLDRERARVQDHRVRPHYALHLTQALRHRWRSKRL